MAETKRGNYLPAPAAYNLSMACRIVYDAFGHFPYLVGSSMERRDYRDVDVRLILPDAEFDRLFGGEGRVWHLDAKWSLLCASVSLYLSQHSGLPIDFQIQRMTEANRDNDGPRSALGMFYGRERAGAPDA